jgi:hypothetical protein
LWHALGDKERTDSLVVWIQMDSGRSR